MKITIINQHTLNYGDDIAGISLIEELLETFGDQTEINIIYNTKGRLNYNHENVRHLEEVTLKNMGYIGILLFILSNFLRINYRKNKAVNTFRDVVDNSDYVIVSPCGANIGIYKDWRFLIKLLMSVQLGKKPYFHNNTIGKSNNVFFNKVSKYVLQRSNLYVREKESVEYLSSIDIPSIRSVDTGFLFNNKKKFEYGREYVVFIPTMLNNWHPNFKDIEVENMIFDGVIKEFALWTINKGYNVVILQHLYGNQNEKDLLAFYKQKFLECGMHETKVFIPEVLDCYDYDNFISHSKFTISMRYHGVVMSIKNNVPFISLAYENKMREVCNYAGFIDSNINISEIDGLTPKKVQQLLQNKRLSEKKHEDTMCDLRKKCTVCIEQIKFLEER